MDANTPANRGSRNSWITWSLHTFRRCVQRDPARYPTKTFSHLDQFLCMAFAQLTFREGLRDIETCCEPLDQLLNIGNYKMPNPLNDNQLNLFD